MYGRNLEGGRGGVRGEGKEVRGGGDKFVQGVCGEGGSGRR